MNQFSSVWCCVNNYNSQLNCTRRYIGPLNWTSVFFRLDCAKSCCAFPLRLDGPARLRLISRIFAFSVQFRSISTAFCWIVYRCAGFARRHLFYNSVCLLYRILVNWVVFNGTDVVPFLVTATGHFISLLWFDHWRWLIEIWVCCRDD